MNRPGVWVLGEVGTAQRTAGMGIVVEYADQINEKSYPRTDHIVVRPNNRYRWRFDNQSAEDHPVHLHRHKFEVVRVGGNPVSGIWKDVVVVPRRSLDSRCFTAISSSTWTCRKN